VSDGAIVEPRLRLVQLGKERWNYETPLAPFLGDEEGDGGEDDGLAIRLRDLVVREGDVTIDMLEASYAVRSLDLRLSQGQLSGPTVAGPTFQVAEAEGELALPDTAGESGEVVRSVRIADAGFQLVEGVLSFEIDTARFGESRLAALEGLWNPELGGYGLDMRMRAIEARVADLPWLPGEVPEGAAGSFQLRLEPRPADRTFVALTDLDLRAPGSSATGSIRAVVGGEAPPALESIDVHVDPLALDLAEAFTGPLPYGGALTGSIQGTSEDIRIDLSARLTAPAISDPFTANLTGNLALGDEGVQLRGAEVALERVPLGVLEPVAPGLPLRGPISGTVGLEGGMAQGPLDLDLRLEAAGGIVTATGTADLGGKVPIYDLAGRLAGVNLRSILVPAAPPVELHAEFDLDGRGTDPRTAELQVAVNGSFTGWQAEPGDTLVARVALSGGVVDVEEIRMDAGPVALSAEGRWDYVDGSGEVGYEVAVADLEPLAPYLPPDPEGRRLFARGALRVTGTAEGTLESPTVSGELSAEDFRWGEWAGESLGGSYAFVSRDGLPRVQADVEGQEVRTPAADFDEVSLDVDFGRPEFNVAFQADQEDGRGVFEIDAGGRIDESGQRDVIVRTLEVDLQRQRWRLPEPAEISWTSGEAIRVQGLTLRQAGGSGRIALDGVLLPADEMDASLEIVGLPVGDVLELAGTDIPLSGDLTVTGAVTGPADSPVLDLSLALTDGGFREVRIRSIETEIRYDTATLSIEGEGLLGDSANVEIRGTVPADLRLGGSPLFSLVDDAPIDLRILSRTFPLSTLDPGLAMVDEIEGHLEANLRVAGTPAEPQLSGAARLEGGSLIVPMLNRRFHDIRGRVLLSGRRADLERLVIESGGRAVVRGSLDFENLTQPSLDLSAELNDLQVQAIEGDDAAEIEGTISVSGTLDRPVITGDIGADDGAVSLVPLQQPELSTRLADAGQLQISPEADFGVPETRGGIAVRDLSFTAGDDLRFVTQEADVPLAGTLSIDKSGESVAVQGTLSGEGGSFGLSAGVITRQFQIVSAEIRFFGSPEPNPRLDIVASRQVRTPDGGTVEIEIRVGGTLENPSLGLATATGPAVPESELLSFLLFGRSTGDLGQVAGTGGGQGLLGQSLAYTGVAEALASQLTEALGLVDYFQLDYLPSGEIYATLGVEIADDWFVNADFPVGEADLSAVGVEWRSGIGVLRGALEPVQRLDRLVAARTLSFIEAETLRQWVVAWRNRWTY
jgi:hypothetical protein